MALSVELSARSQSPTTDFLFRSKSYSMWRARWRTLCHVCRLSSTLLHMAHETFSTSSCLSSPHYAVVRRSTYLYCTRRSKTHWLRCQYQIKPFRPTRRARASASCTKRVSTPAVLHLAALIPHWEVRHWILRRLTDSSCQSLAYSHLIQQNSPL